MRLVCLQPGYLPWLGVWSKMNWCDTFILLDSVQYDKNSWRNRNRIKTAQGAQWLTVPIRTKGQHHPLIMDALIDNSVNWKRDHLKSIAQNYSKAPYFNDYIDIFQDLYSKDWKKLVELDVSFIMVLKSILGIKAKLGVSSDMDLEGGKVTRLIDMCLKLGATEFMEGSAGRDYLMGEGEELFKRNNIKLTYQDYQHPVYPQLYGEFIDKLSVVDLLFNCGPNSLKILSNGLSNGEEK